MGVRVPGLWRRLSFPFFCLRFLLVTAPATAGTCGAVISSCSPQLGPGCGAGSHPSQTHPFDIVTPVVPATRALLLLCGFSPKMQLLGVP